MQLRTVMISKNTVTGSDSRKGWQVERQKVEVKAAELKMRRFLFGVTRMDRIRNEDIRGERR